MIERILAEHSEQLRGVDEVVGINKRARDGKGKRRGAVEKKGGLPGPKKRKNLMGNVSTEMSATGGQVTPSLGGWIQGEARNLYERNNLG